MKVVVVYEKLLELLTNVSSVVDDSRNDDNMKLVNLLFTNAGEMKLMGASAFITYKVTMPADAVQSISVEDNLYGDNGIYSIQLKSKELLQFLSAYKGLRRTKVDNVVIETEMGQVKITVCESSLDDESKKTESSWVSTPQPTMMSEMTRRINMKVPENMTTIPTNFIALCASCAMPVMTSEVTTSAQGTLQFCKEKVSDTEVDENGNPKVNFPSKLAIFQNAYRVVLRNDFPKDFQGIALYYKSVAFLKDIICAVDEVDFARMGQYLCFRSEGNFEAFVATNPQQMDVSRYVVDFEREHGIQLDRQYFKDVLRRLALSNQDIRFTYKDGTLTVKNQNFSQDIPLITSKGMEEIGTCNFSIMPDNLSKLVIGDDSAFSDLFIYFVPKGEGEFALYFTDETCYWLSSVNVRR